MVGSVPGHQQVMRLGPRLSTPPEIFSPEIWTRKCLLLPAHPFLARASSNPTVWCCFVFPKATLLWTHFVPSWPGVLGKARLAVPGECPPLTAQWLMWWRDLRSAHGLVLNQGL